MSVKKRSKVNAEFNMSSLTDIIFLLLIFFMLTSSLVTPNALNLQLPGKNKSASSTAPTKTNQIRIERNGTYYYNSSKLNIKGIESKIKDLKKRDGKSASVVISPHKKSKNDKVVAVLDAAYRYGINVVLTEPR